MKPKATSSGTKKRGEGSEAHHHGEDARAEAGSAAACAAGPSRSVRTPPARIETTEPAP